MDKILPGDHGLYDRETGEPMELTMKNILGIALHTGTEDNFDRLTKGYGWSRDGVMAALDKHMTKQDSGLGSTHMGRFREDLAGSGGTGKAVIGNHP